MQCCVGGSCAAGPGPRASAACCIYSNSLILFGGKSGKGCLNDFFKLDLATWQWSQPLLTGKAPGPRQSPAMCLHGLCSCLCPMRVPVLLKEHPNMGSISLSWPRLLKNSA
jgi:hypothetical protein